MTLQERIEVSWESGELDQEAVEETLALLDKGSIRVAEQQGDDWYVHDWIKKAILLFFRCSKMELHEIGPYEFYDKIPLKKNLEAQGVRLVPPGHIRYGAFLERGATHPLTPAAQAPQDCSTPAWPKLHTGPTRRCSSRQLCGALQAPVNHGADGPPRRAPPRPARGRAALDGAAALWHQSGALDPITTRLQHARRHCKNKTQ